MCVERHTTKREMEKNLQSIVWLDSDIAFLSYNSDEVYPLLGEKVACAAISPHMRILVIPASTYQSDSCILTSGGISNEVCHSMRITVAESNPDVGLLI